MRTAYFAILAWVAKYEYALPRWGDLESEAEEQAYDRGAAGIIEKVEHITS
jgi:hypothetical protein